MPKYAKAFSLIHTMLLASCASFAVASITTVAQTASSPAKVSVIHEFPVGTWLENLDQRPSGVILATEFTAPRLWQVDPSKPANQKPVLIASIAGKLGLLGISEISPDVFAVVAGNFNFSSGDINEGSSSIYQVDLTRWSSSSPAVTSKIADFPGAKLLNGLTFLPRVRGSPKGVLLSTDSMLGAIWSLDLALAKPKPVIWAQDPLMAACDSIGINGLKFDGKNNKVYFSNLNCQGGFLASIKIDPRSYKAVGKAEIVGGKSQGAQIDDFDIDLDRRVAFTAANPENQVSSVDLKSGALKNLAGSINSTLLAQPTACKIGRTGKDKQRGLVYVTTTGGYPDGINGKVIGGQVIAIDTKDVYGQPQSYAI